MTRHKRTGIDETLDEDKFVGLAKEAASKPLPRAEVDVQYYFALAEKEGKPLTPKAKEGVWALFEKTHGERIKNVEAAVKRYAKTDTDEAKAQLEWYTHELARLKEWKARK